MKRPNRDHPIFEFSRRFPLVRQPVHLVNFVDNRCCFSCLVSLLMLFYFTIFILLNFFHITESKRKRTNHHVKCPFVNKLKSPYLKDFLNLVTIPARSLRLSYLFKISLLSGLVP